MRRAFSTVASKAATASGHWLAFTVVLGLIVLWAAVELRKRDGHGPASDR